MKQNDELAFKELYRRYKDRVFYYFYRMLNNSEQKAQDFLQDLFMKVIEKLDTFDTKYCFSTWIFSVAHNMCKNEYRRMSRNKCIEWENFPEVKNDKVTPEDALNRLTENIYRSLGDFDEEHKTCFLLKYREGLSLSEISEIMDVSEGTVKSRLFYTRKKLKERFKFLYKAYITDELY